MLTVLEQKDSLKNIYLKLFKDSVIEVKYQTLLGFLDVINLMNYSPFLIMSFFIIDLPLCFK